MGRARKQGAGPGGPAQQAGERGRARSGRAPSAQTKRLARGSAGAVTPAPCPQPKGRPINTRPRAMLDSKGQFAEVKVQGLVPRSNLQTRSRSRFKTFMTFEVQMVRGPNGSKSKLKTFEVKTFEVKVPGPKGQN